MAEPFRIVQAIYPGVTQLDFTGPYEVFHRLPGAEVTIASATGGELRSEAGLTFAGLAKLSDIESCDLICIPGGPGQTAAMQDPTYLDEVRRLGLTAKYVTSVCTGSLILGAAGLITGKRAACHWAYRDLLSVFGAIPVAERVVRDGNIITGGGVTAGIDFALTVAAEIAGPERAQALQLMIEYDPHPPFNAGNPDTAPAEVVAAVRKGFEAYRAARQEAAEKIMA